MQIVSIDGDDIGRRLTSFYLNNDEKSLKSLCDKLNGATQNIARSLEEIGYRIIFCAADGVVASFDRNIDVKVISKIIMKYRPQEVTFSAGIGDSLRDSYISLLTAKSNGKNCIYHGNKLKVSLNEKISNAPNN